MQRFLYYENVTVSLIKRWAVLTAECRTSAQVKLDQLWQMGSFFRARARASVYCALPSCFRLCRLYSLAFFSSSTILASCLKRTNSAPHTHLLHYNRIRKRDRQTHTGSTLCHLCCPVSLWEMTDFYLGLSAVAGQKCVLKL